MNASTYSNSLRRIELPSGFVLEAIWADEHWQIWMEHPHGLIFGTGASLTEAWNAAFECLSESANAILGAITCNSLPWA